MPSKIRHCVFLGFTCVFLFFHDKPCTLVGKTRWTDELTEKGRAFIFMQGFL